jgi:Fe-S-cluster-containing dehydrogenase component
MNPTTSTLAATPQLSPGPTRRDFFKSAAVLTALTVGGAALASTKHKEEHGEEHGSGLSEDRMGVLVDLSRCIGCRRCEWACSDANGNPHGALSACDDQSVLSSCRNPASDQYTVLNVAPPNTPGEHPLFAKIQCMHCEKPPCVSACLVGAMVKTPEGPVTYDASKCIGCRYCMMACPFERLAYEFNSKLTPRVRKCELCTHRTSEGLVPACVEICPVEALQYGKRADLLRIAHEHIARHPDKYVPRVYGETEGGGTSWLYLSAKPFEEITELGFPNLPRRSPAETTEHIQHGIFKYGAGPLIVASLLTLLNHTTKPKGGGA